MYRIWFYVTSRGESPVLKFIESLDEHTQAKVAQHISLLKEWGPSLKRPFADKVKGKIYELRSRQTRILYFFIVGREVVLVHGFVKKTQRLKTKDIEIAENRMKDWLARNIR